ncbi:hypothetical protein [Actinoplanes missouriensis]|nr:hypothetical protein [Actinoplanes missouriensis]
MSPTRARPRTGALLAAVPHVLILAWMAATLSGPENAYAGFLGVLELFVVPLGLLAAVAARLTQPVRHWARPIAVTTVAGGLLVILVAFLAAGMTGA